MPDFFSDMKDNKRYTDKIKRLLTTEEFREYKKDTASLVDFGYDYIELGDFKKAFKLFSMGARLNGSDPDILNGLGIVLCELGRFKASRSILERAAGLFPDDSITLANLAGVYWEEGDFERALYFYGKSLKADPTILETHFNLINLYNEQGDLFMAYIACMNLIEQHPDNQQAVEMRDDIILNLGLTLC